MTSPSCPIAIARSQQNPVCVSEHSDKLPSSLVPRISYIRACSTSRSQNIVCTNTHVVESRIWDIGWRVARLQRTVVADVPWEALLCIGERPHHLKANRRFLKSFTKLSAAFMAAGLRSTAPRIQEASLMQVIATASLPHMLEARSDCRIGRVGHWA